MLSMYWPPVARLKTTESASMRARFIASTLETSGTGAPGRTAMPWPTRPSMTRSGSTRPASAKASITAGGTMTTSNFSPFFSMRSRICGAVLKVTATFFSCSASAARKPGSTAPALNTARSCPEAVEMAIMAPIKTKRRCMLGPSGFVDDRGEKVLVDHHVDHRRLAARQRPCKRGAGRCRFLDALTVRAQHAGEGGEIDVVVINAEKPASVQLL